MACIGYTFDGDEVSWPTVITCRIGIRASILVILLRKITYDIIYIYVYIHTPSLAAQVW